MLKLLFYILFRLIEINNYAWNTKNVLNYSLQQKYKKFLSAEYICLSFFCNYRIYSVNNGFLEFLQMFIKKKILATS